MGRGQGAEGVAITWERLIPRICSQHLLSSPYSLPALSSLVAAVKTLATLELSCAALNYTAAAAAALGQLGLCHAPHCRLPTASLLYIDLTSGNKKKPKLVNECGTRRCLLGPNNAPRNICIIDGVGNPVG